MRLWLLVLLLISSNAIGEHSTLERGNRPLSTDSSPASCLSTLNDTQKEILSVIRTELEEKRPAHEVATTLYRRAADPRLSTVQREQVVSLAVASGAEETQREHVQQMADSGELKELISAGARLKNGELDFEGFDFNRPLSGPEKNALAKTFPAVGAMIPRLDDPKRRFPVILGAWVVLPKGRLTSHENFRAMRLEEYKAGLESKRQELARDIAAFIRADNVANSGISRFFNRSRSHERNALDASNRVSRLISELVDDYGIPPAAGQKMREAFSLALKESDGNIAKGMRQLYISVGITATLLGVAIPAVIALSPYAGALATFFTTTAPGVAALTSGGLGLTTTAADIGVRTSISAYRGDGTLLCNLGKNAFDKGPSGIASALISVGVGLGTGAVAVQAVHAAREVGVSEPALNGFAATVSAISPFPSVITAFNHHQVAVAYRRMARSAKASQDDILAEQYLTEADQSEGKAGLSVAMAAASPYISNAVTQKLLDPTAGAAAATKGDDPAPSASSTNADLEKTYQNFRVPHFPSPPPLPVRPALPLLKMASAGKLGAALSNAENSARLRAWRERHRRGGTDLQDQIFANP